MHAHIPAGSLWRDGRRILKVRDFTADGWVLVWSTNRFGDHWQSLRAPVSPERFARPGTDRLTALLSRLYVPLDRLPPGVPAAPGHRRR